VKSMKKSFAFIAAVLAACFLLTGCTVLQASSSETLTPAVPQQTVTATNAPVKPKILSMEAIADPSLAASAAEDPYDGINKYTLGIQQPDRDLYNALYRAVLGESKSFDVSSYNLTVSEKVKTAESLLSEGGLRFFYLKNVKLSKDGNTVTLTEHCIISAPIQRFCIGWYLASSRKSSMIQRWYITWLCMGPCLPMVRMPWEQMISQSICCLFRKR